MLFLAQNDDSNMKSNNIKLSIKNDARRFEISNTSPPFKEKKKISVE